MSAYVALAAVLLFGFIGVVDAARGRRAARAAGTLGLLLAAFVAAQSVWRVCFDAEVAALPRLPLALLAGAAVVLGLVADGLNDQRTKAVGAPIALLVFGLSLPGAGAGTPSLGAVLFLAALSLLAGSVTGGVVNRLLRAIRRLGQ